MNRLVLILLLLLAGSVYGSQSGLINSKDACGVEERFEWESDTPKVLLKLFAKNDGNGPSFKLWSMAAQAKRAVTKPDLQAIVDLAAARAMYSSSSTGIT